MQGRKKLAAIGAAAAIAAGTLGLMFGAHAAVPAGNHIEVGCSSRFEVLVYTTVDGNGNPTGRVSALPYACTDSPDLQDYVRVSVDPVFGNLIVRVYADQLRRGTPLDIEVLSSYTQAT